MDRCQWACGPARHGRMALCLSHCSFILTWLPCMGQGVYNLLSWLCPATDCRASGGLWCHHHPSHWAYTCSMAKHSHSLPGAVALASFTGAKNDIFPNNERIFHYVVSASNLGGWETAVLNAASALVFCPSVFSQGMRRCGSGWLLGSG